MREFSRLDRIAEQVKQELNIIIQRQINDPRLALITSVNHVKISKDLAFADIYVSFLHLDTSSEDLHQKTEENLHILRSAAGFIRHVLCETIKLRQIPQLRFHEDLQAQQANRIDYLLSGKK